MTIDLLLTGILQSLILAIIAYAIMIPFRILNFADLTTEGTYPLSGAICATCLALGLPALLATLLAVLGAGVTGIATSLIHLRLRVNSLLAGIILTSMAYSINLRIMGKSNIALFEDSSLFGNNNITDNILILSVITLIYLMIFTLFLRTNFGLKLRAVVLNPDFAHKKAISTTRYTIFGLFVAGSMSGLAGSFMVQLQNYMDIAMGVGIVIHGLAALMIGEAIIGSNSMNKQLLAPLVGAILYQQIQGIALSLGLAPSDLKFFTSSIVLIVIAIKRNNENMRNIPTI